MGNDKKWIRLNVGGTYFATLRSTLTRSAPPSSSLHRIASNSTSIEWDRDQQGAYMIDRDPVFFQPVLNFLRNGRLVLSRDVPEEAILLEAEYYNLPELIKAIKQRTASRRYMRAYNQIAAAAAAVGTPPITATTNMVAASPPCQIQASPMNSFNQMANNQLSREYLTSYVNNILEDDLTDAPLVQYH